MNNILTIVINALMCLIMLIGLVVELILHIKK